MVRNGDPSWVRRGTCRAAGQPIADTRNGELLHGLRSESSCSNHPLVERASIEDAKQREFLCTALKEKRGAEDEELVVNIAVIGTGNVGTALGRGWSTAGHDVIWGTRRPDSSQAVTPVADLRGAAAAADVVVLAVPFDALGETVAALGDLTGRVLVDATNVLGQPLPDGARSGAEYLANLARGARVVKAFNTMGWETMADPVIEGRRAVCLICADDPEARNVVAGLAGDLGFEAIEAGGLEAARLLEALGALWVHLAFRAGLGRQFAFSLLHRSKG
jgi:8-hydroxy-5-deazaflavin:NADPH oxidoreductase